MIIVFITIIACFLLLNVCLFITYHSYTVRFYCCLSYFNNAYHTPTGASGVNAVSSMASAVDPHNWNINDEDVEAIVKELQVSSFPCLFAVCLIICCIDSIAV